MVAKAWYVVFSSWIIMKTAVFLSPIVSISKSLRESISAKFWVTANTLIFCFNTDKIEFLVSCGAFTVPKAFIAAGDAGSLNLKYSFM